MPKGAVGFSDFEDLMDSQGDVALQLEFDHQSSQAFFTAYTPLPDASYETLQKSYLLACDNEKITKEVHDSFLSLRDDERDVLETSLPPENPIEVFNISSVSLATNYTSRNDESSRFTIPNSKPNSAARDDNDAVPVEVFVKSKKKYKPVALKVNPVPTELPKHFRIVRNRVGDPLEGMPSLDPNPPPFQPTGRYTAERREALRSSQPHLRPAELDVLDDMMCKQNKAFAWDDNERGTFRSDMFPRVKLAVVDHVPWVQ